MIASFRLGLAPLLAALLTGVSIAQMTRDPETNLVVPSAGQQAWHADEIGVFYHMNPTFPVNTMTFANFDPVAVINAAERVGAKHIVVVAKHVDGFCWWPTQAKKPGSAANASNIALTAYKNGHGDVVRELFDEARRRGIRPGIYLATRDDHFGAGEQGSYPANQQAYNDYYLTQAMELATQYGELAEWWLDGGASGSLGASINQLLATHQPNAVVFQGSNATLRWIGNESGNAPYPTWNTISQASWNTIMTSGGIVTTGDPNGVRWVPAEVDTHLSTGWFSGGPRSLADLSNVYYQSVGRGAGLLLNFPVQADGTVRADNLARGVELGKLIDDATGHPLYAVADQDGAQIIIDFDAPTEIDHVILKEDIRYGERVRSFVVEGWNGSQWSSLVTGGTAIGMKQIRKFAPTTVSKVRLSVTGSVGTPRIRQFAVTRTGVRPPDVTPPSAPTALAGAPFEDQVDLAWEAAGDPETGIGGYKVYRDDLFLKTTSVRTFRDGTAVQNHTYRYRVSATNGEGLEGEKSNEVTVTTGVDGTRPSVVSATTLSGRSKLQVVFSEPMDATTLAVKGNYSLSHGQVIAAVETSPNEHDRVTLTLDAPLGPDIKYTLRIANVTDDADPANAIAPDASISFFLNSFRMTRHWKLDDGAGASAVDSVGGPSATANRAQITGATWSQGKMGGALTFDGNDVADCGVAGVQTNFTMALWVKPQSIAGSPVLIGKDRSGVGAYQQRIYLNAGKPGFLITNQDGSDFGLYPFEGSSALPLNTWSHLAVTNEGNTFKLYVNGQLVLTKQTTDIIQSPYNPANFLIGARWNSGMTGKTNFFTGALDDIRLYDLALPPEELQQLVAEADGVPSADTDGDEMSDAWEMQYAGNLTDMNADSDNDHDLMTDLAEFVSGTHPFDSSDRLMVTYLGREGDAPEWMLKWSSKVGYNYRVEYSENLVSWRDSGLGVIPASAENVTSASVSIEALARFYRVRVGE